MKKKFLSIVLVLSMLCAFMPVIANAATSGSCGANGDNVTWTLDDEGTLTISGEGNMKNYSSYSYSYYAPWYDSRSSITKVVIEQGVTSIGSYAFQSCSNITDVYYNGSYKDLAKISIGDYNGNLTNSTIHCDDFRALKWGKCGNTVTWFLDDEGTLTISGEGDMWDYYSYSKVPWYDSRLSITNVVIEQGVTSIGSNAFNSCSDLTRINIPDNVTKIGDSVFAGCSSLTYIEIPSGVTSVGSHAFYACSSLTNIDIPDSVTSIGICAFQYCSSLASVTIPNSVISIGGSAFFDCYGLTSITIGSGVTSIGEYAFDDCDNLNSVYISDLAAYLNIDFYIDRYGGSSNPMYYADKLYLNGKRVAGTVKIPAGVTKIPYYAFDGCDGIKSVEISDSVKNIGSNAFSGCSGLTSVTIPYGVASIGDYSFYDCSGLTSVYIPNSITSIGEYAFSGCSGLTSITIPNSVTSVGSYALTGCKELTTVNYNAPIVASYLLGTGYSAYVNNVLLIVLGDNVKSIDTDAFTDCSKLKRIIIPKSVTEIEKAAFKDCISLSTVEYGGSETDWNEMYIGTENENLENANIIFNSSLSNTTLTDLDYLTYTVNEDNTVTITNCYENATKINIPKEIDGKPVTAINASAFANRSKLTSVTIPESVTSIGERAFYGCGALTDIVIPSGVTTIESNTFYDCGKLKNVTIPKSVTAIKSYAFYGCGSLTDTYYSGTDEEFKSISMGEGNTSLSKSNIHYSSTAPTPTPKPTPLPVTTAEITKAETDTAYTFTVTPETAYENCFVYAAVYDADGALISVKRVPLELTGSTAVSLNKQENGVTAKVFVWSDFMQSIIEHAKEFPLT